jgi:hypothetical protein
MSLSPDVFSLHSADVWPLAIYMRGERGKIETKIRKLALVDNIFFHCAVHH